MKRRFLAFVLAILLLVGIVPQPVQAAVTDVKITEVDPNDDWVEITNLGTTTVSIDHWYFENDGDKSDLYTGTLAPGEVATVYSIKGIGGGENIVLYTDNGTRIDHVDGMKKRSG